MVAFAGWEMPVQYRSILAEHAAVRERAGVFDISHMGQFVAAGAGVAGWLDGMLTNRVAALEPGQGQYTLMLNPDGGVIDDLIIYRTGGEEFLLVVNAARLEEDFEWLHKHLDDGVSLRNDSDGWARMAVQGPQAVEAFAKVAPGAELPPRNGVARGRGRAGPAVFAAPATPARTGSSCSARWRMARRGSAGFVDAGVEPCGLGARDTLRLEMCYPLNGSDLLRDRTPLEAGLGFFVDAGQGRLHRPRGAGGAEGERDRTASGGDPVRRRRARRRGRTTRCSTRTGERTR